MTLNDRQWNFLKDLNQLIIFISSHTELAAAGGELMRTKYQQDEYLRRGLTSVKNSKHQDSLAIDLKFFKNGVYLGQMNRDEVFRLTEPIGEYWENIRPGNVWGGRWKKPFDPWHFEA